MSDPSTARHRLVECPDCISTVHTAHHPGAVMTVEVEHDATCPYWRGNEDRELAITMLPPESPSRGSGVAGDPR